MFNIFNFLNFSLHLNFFKLSNVVEQKFKILLLPDLGKSEIEYYIYFVNEFLTNNQISIIIQYVGILLYEDT